MKMVMTKMVMTKRLKELAAETTESQLAELAVKIRDSVNQNLVIRSGSPALERSPRPRRKASTCSKRSPPKARRFEKV